MTETWDLWFPDAGATGISFCRSRVDSAAAGERVLVHAAPPTLDVVVRSDDDTVTASGRSLSRGEPGPISFLRRSDDKVWLEDGWPSPDDLGRLVLLPGGEAGILRTWWHAPDHSEWRWSVEFFNHV
jgi:hypothetical protein